MHLEELEKHRAFNNQSTSPFGLRKSNMSYPKAKWKTKQRLLTLDAKKGHLLMFALAIAEMMFLQCILHILLMEDGFDKEPKVSGPRIIIVDNRTFLLKNNFLFDWPL